MKKAFTLIELLVVIAIIAILAAILFPVFAQAKAAAKKTASLSNVKQTALGVLIYSGDSDDMFPFASGNDWWYPNGSWVWGTQPYIKSYPMLVDPSDPKSKSFWPSWMNPTTTLPISYAANSLIKKSATSTGQQVVGLVNMLQSKDVTPGGWYDGPGVVSQTQVNRVADTILFSSHYYGQNLWGTGALIAGSYPGWDFSAPTAHPQALHNGTAERGTGATPYVVTSNGATVTVNKDARFGSVAVYGDQGIFAFADGHAKTMNPLRTNPNERDDNALDVDNMWNAQRP